VLPIVHEVLRSPGRPLDPATRAFFEPRFGYDFSRVRVYEDAKESPSLQSVDASIDRQTAPTGTTVPATVVTQQEIGRDLSNAKTWTGNATRKIEGYARIVKALAQDSRFSYKIGTTELGRGQVHGVHCALLDNFNVDPEIDEPAAYARWILTISDRLAGIRDRLATLGPQDFQHVPFGDPRCEGAGAFVESKALPIYLCAWYWPNASARPATIIHEVAHLKGMSDVEYEDSEGWGLPPPNCLRWRRFSIEVNDTAKNPDSYALFCADAGK
jgi:hypothetical protein